MTTATRVGGDDSPVSSPKTGILMMNMGGPSSLEGEEDGVGPFLKRLFTDGEIITLGPLQNVLVSMTSPPTMHEPADWAQARYDDHETS
jgi:protoheme ferro-lyase